MRKTCPLEALLRPSKLKVGLCITLIAVLAILKYVLHSTLVVLMILPIILTQETIVPLCYNSSALPCKINYGLVVVIYFYLLSSIIIFIFNKIKSMK